MKIPNPITFETELDLACERISDIEATNALLVEALEFYSDKDGYYERETVMQSPYGGGKITERSGNGKILNDRGETARQALASAKSMGDV